MCTFLLVAHWGYSHPHFDSSFSSTMFENDVHIDFDDILYAICRVQFDFMIYEAVHVLAGTSESVPPCEIATLTLQASSHSSSQPVVSESSSNSSISGLLTCSTYVLDSDIDWVHHLVDASFKFVHAHHSFFSFVTPPGADSRSSLDVELRPSIPHNLQFRSGQTDDEVTT